MRKHGLSKPGLIVGTVVAVLLLMAAMKILTTQAHRERQMKADDPAMRSTPSPPTTPGTSDPPVPDP